ncbi:MAG: type III-A CRISPR-associated protein Csm2 [Aquificaceae bacterium]
MSQSMHRGGQGSNSYVSEFINKLKSLGGDISRLDDRDIFHPEGYASKIVENLGLKGVQLRRFYSEIRNIYDRLQEGKKKEELKYYLYRLYAITQYQENRGVIKRDFGNLVRSILDSIEKNFTEESLRKASDFFMAMVAYSKKES